MEYERKRLGDLCGTGRCRRYGGRADDAPEQSQPECYAEKSFPDKLAAKAANKMEDVAWKISDTLSDKFEDM
mgnify:CR=1 FL=1